MSDFPNTHGRYLVERLLGEQRSGRFFAAVDRLLGGRVTLFFPKLSGISPQRFLNQMQSEVGRCKPLRETPYCSIKEVELSEEGEVMVVVERPQGVPLASLFKDQGPLSIDQGLSIGIQLCDLLRRAHSIDIFPLPPGADSIILEQRPGGHYRVSIVDLGLQRLYAGQISHGNPSQLYQAPQLRAGEPPDPRDDIFQVTALVHLMIFGVAPSTMSLHGPADGSGWPLLPSGQRLERRLESCLHTIFLKGLSPSRAGRFSQVAALGRALTGLRQLMSLSAPAFELLAATRGRLDRSADPLEDLNQGQALKRAQAVRARIHALMDTPGAAHLSEQI